MTDSAETMREALKEARDTLEALRKQLHGEPFAQNRDRWLNLGMRTVDAIKKADAALSASGTKSEIDEAGLELAVRECARITAPEITDAEYEAIRKGKDPRYLNTCAEMRRALIAYLGEAGEASIKPGPSDPMPSQPDEREAIAEQLQGWADFIDTEAAQSMSVASAAYANGGSLADDLRSAILAMQAERRGAKP